MKPDGKGWYWQPDYRIGNQFITIRGVNTNECPTSVISCDPNVELMISLFLRNKSLNGLGILGNGSELPAKVVDALEVLAVEEVRTDRELEIAIRTRPPKVNGDLL